MTPKTMERETSVVSVASHSKAVVPHARCPAMTVHSVCGLFFYFFASTDLPTPGGSVWGECTHVFHMHCLLQWIGTASSKQQCPMDRRPWGASIFCLLRSPSFIGCQQLRQRGRSMGGSPRLSSSPQLSPQDLACVLILHAVWIVY